jgi:excinuclease ABC subunit C
MKNITSEELLLQIKSLPSKPGVYQYFNNLGEIIYIGKAKNLKKRVSSYFNKIHDSGKTNVLVKNIASIKYIVVETEEDALLLENNLIKKHQPRYNVLLKDGKTYPSICITNEEFPRIFKTRNILKNGSLYFGPYSSTYTIDAILEIVHKLYPIRTCKLPLSIEKINAGKFNLCLQYHLKKCNGPCEGKESIFEYRKHIDEIREIIKGNADKISKILYEEMMELSSNLRFEEANKVKEKYDLIQNYQSKSIIANTILDETDVFGYEEDEKNVYISIIRVSKGAIVQGLTIEYKKRILGVNTEDNSDSKKEILSLAIIELRERLKSASKEILLPFDIDFKIKGITFSVPQKGDRKKLLDLAQQNVRLYKLEKLKQTEKLNPEQRGMQLLKAVQEKLQLEKIPLTIECFDNSNIQGSDAVAACVVFKKGKPSKQDYRKYIIKTVDGPDDYASMKEVVHRRYSRMLKEETPLPDLIIADGGIGQMEIIRKVIIDELNLNIPIAGLAKNNKHKTNEVLIGFPPKSVGLKPTDQLFKFFAGIQEEVHRFAIQFHREKRSKSQTTSELDLIKGIGEITKKELITHFKSIKRLRLAKFEDIEKVIGKHRASIVYEHFKGNLKP